MSDNELAISRLSKVLLSYNRITDIQTDMATAYIHTELQSTDMYALYITPLRRWLISDRFLLIYCRNQGHTQELMEGVFLLFFLLSPPLRTRTPLNQLGNLGERCRPIISPQRGSGTEPRPKTNLVHSRVYSCQKATDGNHFDF